MADFDAQALLKLPREQLISLVVNNLNLTTAESAEKMRDDEIVHMLRMNLDEEYQKQVSSVSKTNSKKVANKKAPVKKTAEAKTSNEKANTDKPSKTTKKSVKPSSDKVEDKKASEEVKEVSQEVKLDEVKPEEKVVLEEPVKKTSKRTARRKETSKKIEVKETPVAELNEVSSNAEVTDTEVKAEVAEKTSKSKRTSRKTKKTEEVSSEVEEKISESSNPVTEESDPSTKITSESETNEPKKKTSRKNKKPVKNTDSEVKPETVTEEKKDEAPVEEIPSEPEKNKKPRPKKNKKSNKPEEANQVSAEDSGNNEVSTEVNEVSNESKPKNDSHKKPQRRTISFGPGVGLKVEATAPVEAENAEVQAAEEPVEQQPAEPEIQLIPVAGVLSIGGEKNDYCGFLHANNYLPGDSDSYVSGQLIKRMGLRKGDYITGIATPARGKGNHPPLKQILTINGIDVSGEDFDLDTIRKRKKFENLTAIYPDEKLVLETGKDQYSTRIIDIICPIGKGQRGMVVSPPKAGKTVLLKKIANAITANDPKCKLIVLLIDERPEEVTDMQRSIKGEVVYSTFDKKPENHVRVTELVLERAMRLVEMDEDVVILLDSMTRLARAYNLTITPTGRTLSGGLDPGSLYGPKRFFGAARNIENGGSLTIISTSLIETGSRMDEVIFEEFKGTGNMEVVLDRKLADRRVFPAIAVDKSGTRREDLLLSPEELDAVWKLRKRIADFDTVVATDLVIKLMERTPSNKVFVDTVIKKFDEADNVK